MNNLFNRTLMSLKPTADTDNDKLWKGYTGQFLDVMQLLIM